MIISGRTGLAQSYQGGVKILMTLPDRTPSPTPSVRTTSGLRPNPRRFGRINWVGLQTLYLKEVRRFLAVWTQTLLAPMVTTLLFLAVFTLALGGGRTDMSIGAESVSFGLFLIPGLVMMAMAQNAFANTSSSLVIAKVQGNIVDLLMPPLSPREVLVALALGGMTRGVVVGIVILAAIAPFIHLPISHLGYVVFHAFAASLCLSLIGIVGGIWSEKFDHIAAVTNFIVTPLTFLSGTFYTVERLPANWRFIAELNPFHYMIDGFRYGFIGLADSHLSIGIAVMVGCNIFLLVLGERMLTAGYKLKP